MTSSIKRAVAITAFVLVSAYAVVALRGPGGMSALGEKRREVQSLEEQNARLSREIQQKHDRIERLKNSTSEQELEIRRKLKLQRPGETTFILPEPPKTDSSSSK